MIANTAAKSKAAENIAISPKELKKLAMCRKSFEFSRMGLTYDGTKEVLFSVKAMDEVKKLIMAGKENVEGAVRTFYEGFSPDWFSCDAEFMSAKENSMKRILRLYEYIQMREVENIRTDVFYENNFVRALNYRGLAIKTIRGKFDFVFQDKTGKTVCVILHYGKPTESSKARKPENLPENSPELLVATSAARNSIAGDFSVELWYLRGKDDNGTVVAPKFEHRPEKNVISADFTKESTEKLLTRMVSVLARAEKRDCSNCMHKDVCKTDGVIRKTESECTTEKASVKEITLTESQQEVVNHVNGPMCVVAVPGAGKTASLVARMMHLIKDVHVKPGKILFVSFTKKAAKEIRDRVEVQLSQYGLSGRPQIMTYNALGFSILKENPLYVGRRIKLAEDLDRYDLIFKALTKEPKIEKMSYLNPKGEHGLVRFLDGKFEEIYERGEESFRTQYMERYDVDGIIRVYRSYKAMYDAEGYIDYDDQISMVNELFDEYSVLSQRYAEKYEYIMVDEFQDSSQEQVDMIYSIARCHGNIVVSGDDDQSIYKFRGGSSQFMLEFEDDFPGAKVLYMEDNFRSNGKILRLCEALINGNEVRFQKVLRAHVKGESQPPVYLKDVQPPVVRDTVKKALESGYKPGDIAILARNNKRLDEITMILDGVCPMSIPKDYMIEDTVFRCIYDLMTLHYRGMDMDLALYRMLKVLGITEMQKANRFDSLYENLVQSGQIAKVSLTPECLEKYSREITPLGKAMYKLLLCFEKLAYGQLHEALAFIIKECFGIDRHLVVDDLVEIAEERGIVKLESLYQVMKEMIAFGSNERVGYDSREDAVNLLTCHDSKGKEFPVVIIYGMEDFDVRSEEETRVLYVAMSRAKEHLYMVETAYNRFGGFERISPYCTVAGGR